MDIPIKTWCTNCCHRPIEESEYPKKPALYWMALGILCILGGTLGTIYWSRSSGIPLNGIPFAESRPLGLLIISNIFGLYALGMAVLHPIKPLKPHLYL